MGQLPEERAVAHAGSALEHGNVVAFAEIDIDEAPEIAEAVPITNVPAVGYYRGGRLVAALVGAGQSVSMRVARVLRGDSIGRDDGTPHEMRHDPMDWLKRDGTSPASG